MRAANEPSLAIVRLIPNANDSSLPRNHLAIAVVTATISDSAPRPKIRRPAAIGTSDPQAAVIAAPAKHSTPNSSVALRVPIRSMITPPSSTMNTLGIE